MHGGDSRRASSGAAPITLLSPCPGGVLFALLRGWRAADQGMPAGTHQNVEEVPAAAEAAPKPVLDHSSVGVLSTRHSQERPSDRQARQRLVTVKSFWAPGNPKKAFVRKIKHTKKKEAVRALVFCYVPQFGRAVSRHLCAKGASCAAANSGARQRFYICVLAARSGGPTQRRTAQGAKRVTLYTQCLGSVPLPASTQRQRSGGKRAHSARE